MKKGKVLLAAIMIIGGFNLMTEIVLSSEDFFPQKNGSERMGIAERLLIETSEFLEEEKDKLIVEYEEPFHDYYARELGSVYQFLFGKNMVRVNGPFLVLGSIEFSDEAALIENFKVTLDSRYAVPEDMKSPPLEQRRSDLYKKVIGAIELFLMDSMSIKNAFFVNKALKDWLLLHYQCGIASNPFVGREKDFPQQSPWYWRYGGNYLYYQPLQPDPEVEW
ncbi:MAG: hypothetical protein WBQ73_02325 [Candidatus Babeliales bacterium]